MHKPTAIFLAAAILAALSAGCVTHSLLIDLRGEPNVRYMLDGDSLDLYDGRIQLPDKPPWTLVRRESGMNADSTLTVQLEYTSPLNHTLIVPLGPPEAPGSLRVDKANNLLFRRTLFRAVFPSWNVTEKYGDPDAYAPDESDTTGDAAAGNGATVDSLLEQVHKVRMQRLRARGMQHSTAERYVREMGDLLASWYVRHDRPLDSTAVADGMARFSGVLQAYLMTLRGRDPLDVSLEWYSKLRGAMASSASEATGGPVSWFEAAADSIEFRYKSWLDLEDDEIQVGVILPATKVFANADTTRGDTLFWTVKGAAVADSTLVLVAQGFTPHWPVVIPLLVVLLLGGGFVTLKLARRSSGREIVAHSASDDGD